ncbi:MAG: hypothetical protein K1X53_00605 [Candidatus Sumerlaeaceae bacterium]|nr:hypothetical protein [Candidatus Sumerlaeaceae bacterium]
MRPGKFRCIVWVLIAMGPGLCAAHVLENFGWLEVNRHITIDLGKVRVGYNCVLTSTALVSPPPALDTNGNGSVEDAECDDFLKKSQAYLALDLLCAVNGQQVRLDPTDFALSPDHRSFSADFSASVSAPSTTGTPEVFNLVDPAYLGAGVRGGATPDTQIDAGRGVLLFPKDGNPVPKVSMPSGVTLSIGYRREALAGNGPVVTQGTSVSESSPDATPPASGASQELLAAVNDRSAGTLKVLLYTLIATMLGAVHALTPGHGKTMVAAYLVGSRGRIRDAVILGLATTIAHTGSVIVLGLGVVMLSHYIVPSQLYTVLSLVSGSLVFGLGLWLLATRLREDGHHGHGHGGHGHTHHHHTSVGGEPHIHHAHEHVHEGVGGGDLVHSHPHEHMDGHTHDEIHHHLHDAGHSHVHGVGEAVVHRHSVPPGSGQGIHIKALHALGFSGGMVPCVDALVVLLAAIAVNRVLLGLLMVAAFSLGLAAVLILVGILMVSARSLVNRLTGGGESRVTSFYLPVASAAVVTVLGFGMVVGVLMQMGIVRINL